jgi:peptide/nickel transport system substrate-binding protein
VAAQRLIWTEGNTVVPVFVPTVNAHVAGLSGVRVEPWSTFADAHLA